MRVGMIDTQAIRRHWNDCVSASKCDPYQRFVIALKTPSQGIGGVANPSEFLARQETLAHVLWVAFDPQTLIGRRAPFLTPRRQIPEARHDRENSVRGRGGVFNGECSFARSERSERRNSTMRRDLIAG